MLAHLKTFTNLFVAFPKIFSQVRFDKLHRQGMHVERRRHRIDGEPFRDPSLPNRHRQRKGGESLKWEKTSL